MYQLILVFHVLIAMSVIGLVLLQHGKGADVGAGFGSGASNTIFGSQGSGGFLFKLTGGLVIAFFATSLILSSIVANQYKKVQNLNSQPVQNSESKRIPIPSE